MNTWGYRINQWPAVQRFGLLVTLLLFINLSAYVLLYQPEARKTQVIMRQQEKIATVSQELAAFTTLSSHFVYQKDLASESTQQIVQATMTPVPMLTLKTMVAAPATVLPSMTGRFTYLPAALNLSFLSMLQKNSVKVVLSSDFNAWMRYLKMTSPAAVPLYFSRVDFKMERYPVATITLTVFTLGA